MSKHKKEWSPEIEEYINNTPIEEFAEMINDIYETGDQAQKDRINKGIKDEIDKNDSRSKN